jgi:hypothetical protein
MHRIVRRYFGRYLVSMLVVPGLLVGLVFASTAVSPAASNATSRVHMTHAFLTSARPMDEGTVTAQNASFTVLERARLNEAAGTLQAGATDTDPDASGTYTVSLYSGTSDGTLTLDLNGDGGFTYVPDTAFVGTDSFQFVLTDSDGNVSAPATATITVEGVESAPATSYSIPENQPWSVSAGVLLTGATDTDTSASCCTATLDTPVSDGTVTLDSNGDGGFTYTPDSGFEGTDSFTYLLTDSDGNVSAPTTVTMNVGDYVTTHTSIVETSPPATGPGDTVTIVAQVKQPCNCEPAPTGTVIFTYYTEGDANQGPISGSVGSAPLVSVPDVGIEASITTRELPAGGPQNGSITINATYEGDSFNAGSYGGIPYFVLEGCNIGSWPNDTQGYPNVNAGGPEGYYIGQEDGGWYEVKVTHPSVGNVTFSGTVKTGPAGKDYTDGLLLDLSSLKDEGDDNVALVGSNEITFTLVNGGDVDGFSFYAGCGSYLHFTLDIGKVPVKAQKNQIFVGINGTYSKSEGKLNLKRKNV